jgi:hypothetical protein
MPAHEFTKRWARILAEDAEVDDLQGGMATAIGATLLVAWLVREDPALTEDYLRAMLAEATAGGFNWTNWGDLGDGARFLRVMRAAAREWQ